MIALRSGARAHFCRITHWAARHIADCATPWVARHGGWVSHNMHSKNIYRIITPEVNHVLVVDHLSEERKNDSFLKVTIFWKVCNRQAIFYNLSIASFLKVYYL